MNIRATSESHLSKTEVLYYNLQYNVKCSTHFLEGWG